MAEIADVVRSGDYWKSLEALRDKLASELDGTSDGTKVAALAKQLRDVLNTLKSKPVGKEKSVRDELAERRENRRAKVPPAPTPSVDLGAGGD